MPKLSSTLSPTISLSLLIIFSLSSLTLWSWDRKDLMLMELWFFNSILKLKFALSSNLASVLSLLNAALSLVLSLSQVARSSESSKVSPLLELSSLIYLFWLITEVMESCRIEALIVLISSSMSSTESVESSAGVCRSADSSSGYPSSAIRIAI